MMHAAANASPPSRDATCALAQPAGPQPHTGEQHAAAAPLFAPPAATTAEAQVRMPVHPPCNATSQRSVVTSCARVTCALAPCDARPPTATHTPSCGLYPATAGTSASWSRATHTSPLALRLTTGTGAAHHRGERWRGGGGAGSPGLVLPGVCASTVVAGCRVTAVAGCRVTAVAGAPPWRARLYQAQLHILRHVITSASRCMPASACLPVHACQCMHASAASSPCSTTPRCFTAAAGLNYAQQLPVIAHACQCRLHCSSAPLSRASVRPHTAATTVNPGVACSHVTGRAAAAALHCGRQSSMLYSV